MILLIVCTVIVLVSGIALAASGFSLPRWVIPGGGASSAGDAYDLSGSIGQPAAGTLSGGAYILNGGFWAGGVPPLLEQTIYLPVVIR
jgi:hypothetical protein